MPPVSQGLLQPGALGQSDATVMGTECETCNVARQSCGRGASPDLSPRCDRPTTDREDSRTTLVIGFISAENAGRAPRNPVRSQVAMGTGGNRLELGRVLALPGWSYLAWLLLEHVPIATSRDTA